MDEDLQSRLQNIEERTSNIERDALSMVAGASMTIFMLVDLLVAKGVWSREEVLDQLRRLRPEPAKYELDVVHQVNEGLVYLLENPPAGEPPDQAADVADLASRVRGREPRPKT